MDLQLPSIRAGGGVALAATALALTACGDDSSGSTTSASGAAAPATARSTAPPGSASTRLALTAEEEGGLRFDRRTLRAAPGEVTITLDSPSGNQTPHAVEIEGEGVERASGTIEPGSRTEVTANLRPGAYPFYCPVDGHRQAGMEGTPDHRLTAAQATSSSSSSGSVGVTRTTPAGSRTGTTRPAATSASMSRSSCLGSSAASSLRSLGVARSSSYIISCRTPSSGNVGH